MKKTLLKALINLAMIQTVIFMTSINVAVALAPDGSLLSGILAVYMFGGLLTLIPSALVSLAFAYLGDA